MEIKNENRMLNVGEAVKYGVPQALLINHLRLFIRGNKRKGLHQDESGKTWTYSTYPDIVSEYPFWSIRQVGSVVKRLREAGVIATEKRGFKPETWFSFIDESMLQMESHNSTKPVAQPYKSVESTIYTEKKLKDTKKEGDCSIRKKASKSEIEALYQSYPRHVAKRAALVAIGKALERIAGRVDDPVKWMHDRVTLFARSPVGQSGQFCPHPSTWFSRDRFDDDVGEWEKSSETGKQKPQANRFIRPSFIPVVEGEHA